MIGFGAERERKAGVTKVGLSGERRPLTLRSHALVRVRTFVGWLFGLVYWVLTQMHCGKLAEGIGVPLDYDE